MALNLTATGIQHIGLPTKSIQETIDFYTSLGFEVDWQTPNKKLAFIKLGNLSFESYETPDACGVTGAIDHIAINVADVEAAFKAIKEAGGYHMIEDEIQFLPFYENGVKFFNIIGPNAEKIEFNQKL